MNEGSPKNRDSLKNEILEKGKKDQSNQPEDKENIYYTTEDFYQELFEYAREMLESLKSSGKSERQINKHIESNKNYWTRERLANFPKILPGSGIRTYVENLSPKGRRKIRELPQSNPAQNQDLEKIYADTDKVIRELGYDPSDVQKWVKEFYKNEYDHLIDIVKIYCKMRSLGYRHDPDLSQ